MKGVKKMKPIKARRQLATMLTVHEKYVVDVDKLRRNIKSRLLEEFREGIDVNRVVINN